MSVIQPENTVVSPETGHRFPNTGPQIVDEPKMRMHPVRNSWLRLTANCKKSSARETSGGSVQRPSRPWKAGQADEPASKKL